MRRTLKATLTGAVVLILSGISTTSNAAAPDTGWNCFDGGGSQPGQICPSPWWPPYDQGPNFTAWKAYIGSDSEGQWIAWLPQDGSGVCEWDWVDEPSGMTWNLTVQGGLIDDTIEIVPSSGVTLCGWTLAPPIQNGYSINLVGGVGHDTLYGGTDLGNFYAEYPDQQNSDDGGTIYSYNPNSMLAGANGADLFYMYSSGYSLWGLGFANSDFFVMPQVNSNRCFLMQGGTDNPHTEIDRFYGATGNGGVMDMEWYLGHGLL